MAVLALHCLTCHKMSTQYLFSSWRSQRVGAPLISETCFGMMGGRSGQNEALDNFPSTSDLKCRDSVPLCSINQILLSAQWFQTRINPDQQHINLRFIGWGIMHWRAVIDRRAWETFISVPIQEILDISPGYNLINKHKKCHLQMFLSLSSQYCRTKQQNLWNYF